MDRRIKEMNNRIVEPEWRVYRPEECVPLEEICIPLSDCVCIRPGAIPNELLSMLGKKCYDQAPVYDPESRTRWGLAYTTYLRKLASEHRALDADDPHIRDAKKEFRVGAHTSIYQLVHKLLDEQAVIVIRESDATKYGHVESILGLFTIGDLNRHEIRSLLYRLFSDVESGVAKVVERAFLEPWDWIKLLGEEQQVRVLGYWELARHWDVDIGPIAATTLANLLTIVAKSPNLRTVMGFNSRKNFEKHAGKLPEFRNRLMHPVRPLILGQPDVKDLYTVMRFLENLKNRVLESR